MGSVILVRHGESVHQVEGYVGGWSDARLTARGRAQAEAVAARLGGECALRGGVSRQVTGSTTTQSAGTSVSTRSTGEGTCVLACSDLARAVETARPIGEALGVTPQPMAALRSSYMGMVQGMSLAEAREHWIAPTEPLIDWASYPEAETWRQVYGRVAAGMERLLADAPDLLVVVSHKVPIHLALCWWLGIEPDRTSRLWFEIDPGSVTTLRSEVWGGHTVLGVNDTAHLGERGGA